ncbi:MAG: hypothetical protein ACTINU_05115 [Pseudolactococcus laudensis]
MVVIRGALNKILPINKLLTLPNLSPITPVGISNNVVETKNMA